MNPAPLITVTLITYNHEKYISEAIRSVLDQTYRDFELVIVNDGSTDTTHEHIKAFADPRIVYIPQENRGVSEAFNRCLEAAKGKYVAKMSGDDVCYPQRLQEQLQEYAKGGRRILFSGVDLINDQGEPCSGPHFADNVFLQENRTRAQILRFFFDRGNYLNAPSLFTEREVLQEEGPFDPMLLQLQDFEMWIRLVKSHDFWIMPAKLLKYRIRDDNQNLSSPTPEGTLQAINEHNLILRRFFDRVDERLFRDAFYDRLINPCIKGPIELACEQAFLFLNSTMALAPLIGVEKLHGLLSQPDSRLVLKEKYAFTPLSFFKVMKKLNVLNLFQDTVLYFDIGNQFNQEHKICGKSNLDQPQFIQSFTFPEPIPVKSLRWDPPRNRSCRIRISSVSCREVGGNPRLVDLDKIYSNGFREPDGTFVFEGIDPNIVLPVDGLLAGVTIRGSWETITMPATVARFTAMANQKANDSQEREQALQSALAMANQKADEASAREQALQSALAVVDQKNQLLEQNLQAFRNSRYWQFMAPAHRMKKILGNLNPF